MSKIEFIKNIEPQISLPNTKFTRTNNNYFSVLRELDCKLINFLINLYYI